MKHPDHITITLTVDEKEIERKFDDYKNSFRVRAAMFLFKIGAKLMKTKLVIPMTVEQGKISHETN